MLEKVERLPLVKKVKIYRKIIEICLSKNFKVENKYLIYGLVFTYDDMLETSKYAILVYGNHVENERYVKRYGMDYIRKDSDLLEKMQVDRLKYIYEFEKNNKNNEIGYKAMHKLIGIAPNIIKTLAKDYAIKYLGYTNQEYLWERRTIAETKIKARMSYDMLFDLLLRFDSPEDIMYIIEYSKVDMQRIKFNLDKFVMYYIKSKEGQVSDLELLKKQLYNKLKIYFDYKEEIKRQQKEEQRQLEEQEKINLASELVRKYIDSDILFDNKNQYKSYLNVTQNTFERYLMIIKKENPSLYQEYLNKKRYNENARKNDIMEVAKLVAHYVLYGVEYEGRLRNFDIIDAYAISRYSLDEICKACETFLPKEDYIKVTRLRANAQRLIISHVTTKIIYYGEIEIGCKKDKEGFPIEGTGSKLTEEDMKRIRDVFERYNIPKQLFKVAIDRLKNGIDVEDIAFIYESKYQGQTKKKEK